MNINTYRINGSSTLLTILLFILMTVSACSHGARPETGSAELTSVRKYALPGIEGFMIKPKPKDVLELTVPKSWKDAVKTVELNLYLVATKDLEITLVKPGESRFELFLQTSSFDEKKDNRELKKVTREMAEKLKSETLESDIKLLEMKGGSVSGYYYRATLRKPEEGKYLTQGFAHAGKLLLSFIMVSNDGQKELEEAGLNIVRSAVVKSAQ